MVFGEVVTMVGLAAAPADGELLHGDAILHPIVPHIHCFGSLEFGAFVGKAVGGGVVRGDAGGALLRMAEFMKELADVDGLLAIVEEGCDLGFRCCRHDVPEDAAFDVDGSIRGWVGLWVRGAAKIEVPSHP